MELGSLLIIAFDTNNILNLIFSTILFLVITIFFSFLTKKWFFFVHSIIFYSLLVAAYIFEFELLFYCVIIVAIPLIVTFVFTNLSNVRKSLANIKANSTNRIEKRKNNKTNTLIIDLQESYKVINDTIVELSTNKIGAIITFQKKDDVLKFTTNAVDLKGCPVTEELLMSIFYPGTRLHDGAVIIKDGKILAAAAFYDLYSKPVRGKLGSRHRAALGISEKTDSVTVVVSEETGNISIVKNSQITHVNASNFLNIFTELMEIEE